ncbi:MAG: hypothetical protein VR72_13545 [Clostridiaceae bacterium BRH_c20a]|nr:MAG: hypothetical protein VR72_13545 [Clostridiaceae bacterium BRH_c20a]
MKTITEFEWVIEKERIFKIIDCRPKSPAYNNLSRIYDSFLKNIKDIIDPIGVYGFIDIPPNFEFPEMSNCGKIVLCFLTLGEEVSLKTKDYFAKGEYLEAMLLEVIADEIIFKMSEQLYCKALLEAQENGWNLTEKIEPGSENVPLQIQKEIFEKLNLINMGVSISSGNMLMPLKSITYFCGAGEKISTMRKGHNCSNCSMEKCNYKMKI